MDIQKNMIGVFICVCIGCVCKQTVGVCKRPPPFGSVQLSYITMSIHNDTSDSCLNRSITTDGVRDENRVDPIGDWLDEGVYVRHKNMRMWDIAGLFFGDTTANT
jgi:hypothetical protein